MSFTRDMVRQSVFGTYNCSHPGPWMASNKIKQEDHGDIDGDGKIGVGGAQNTIGMWGISLGGIISGCWQGKPAIDDLANAGGAGLVDVLFEHVKRVFQMLSSYYDWSADHQLHPRQPQVQIHWERAPMATALGWKPNRSQRWDLRGVHC